MTSLCTRVAAGAAVDLAGGVPGRQELQPAESSDRRPDRGGDHFDPPPARARPGLGAANARPARPADVSEREHERQPAADPFVRHCDGRRVQEHRVCANRYRARSRRRDALPVARHARRRAPIGGAREHRTAPTRDRTPTRRASRCTRRSSLAPPIPSSPGNGSDDSAASFRNSRSRREHEAA